MSLFITKINDASSNIVFNYLESEHVFGQIVSVNYSFSLSDCQWEDGDDGVLFGVDALKKAYARKNIAAKIGIDEFKNGLVTNISFPESDRVRFGNASISIEERVRVDEDNVLNELFNFVPSPQDIDALEESFSFSRGDNSYSYTRDILLRWRQDPGEQFLNKAKLFLRNIYLGSRPNYGLQNDGISENGRFSLNLKPNISETYDELNKEVRLTENFEANRIETINGLAFSTKKTHSLNLNPDGYFSKNHSIEIAALTEPLERNISSGIQYILQSVLDENTGMYGNPINIEKLIKSDGGVASLSVAFTNDPRKKSTTNVEYIGKKGISESFFVYDFDLNIKSIGQNYLTAFNNSLSYFSGNRNAAYVKLPILFPEFVSGVTNEVSRSVSFNPFQKSVSESVSFSNNPNYADSGDGILKREISVSDSFQIGRNTVLPIYGDKEIIIRNDVGKTLGDRSVSVNMTSATGNLENLSIFLATGLYPPYNYKYITEKRTVLSPLEGSCNATVNFSFFDA